MKCVSISVDVATCLKLGCEMVQNFKPKNHMKGLMASIDSLKKAKELMMRYVKEKEEMNPRRRSQVETWMTSIDAIDRELVDLLEKDASQGRCLLSSFSKCHYYRRKQIARLLSEVSKLEDEKREIDQNLVRQVLPDPIITVPFTTTSIFGVTNIISDVNEFLENDQIRILGIYGMGGIGKTTILTMVNNEILKSRSHNFDLVIWITVSKDVKICNIQNQISNRIGLVFTSDDERIRSRTLFEALCRKKFIFLLDDVWKKLDFTLIGIPMPNNDNRGKIIFTTRSEQVCADMDAQMKIKVGFLSPEDSWMLFRQKVHSSTSLDLPAVQSQAKVIARKCGGLPLALITVARTVSNYTTIGGWDDAVEELRNTPEERYGLRNFMSLLKFTYDKLDQEMVKSCFLYCSLYPEDQHISVHELTTRWMAEGFLDMPQGRDYIKEYNKGLSIVRKLMASCLLEPSSWGERWVKMHDAVRDMALWITSGGQGSNNEFVVYDSSSVSALSDYKQWTNASRVSLMGSGIEQLPNVDMEKCVKLVTLLLKRNYRLKALPSIFFSSMPALQSLDLSQTDLTELPPLIGMLAKLTYLNLYRTKINKIPIELRNLTNLRRLDLASTFCLKTIPRESISHLSSLQSLDMSFCGYEWASTNEYDMLRLEDLENLKYLKNIAINITSVPQLQATLNFKLLLEAIHKVSFKENDLISNHLQIAFTKFSGLRSLHIESCYQLEELRIGVGQLSSLEYICLSNLSIFDVLLEEEETFSLLGPVHTIERIHTPLQSLRQLHIFSCNSLKDVTWVSLLPFLECIHMKDCNGLNSIIVSQTEQVNSQSDSEISQYQEPFRFLQSLHLDNLPNLFSIISIGYLRFSSLRSLEIFGCPRLKKLPFSCNSAENIQEIRSSHEWWEELEWENDTIKSSLLRHHIIVMSPSSFPSYQEPF